MGRSAGRRMARAGRQGGEEEATTAAVAAGQSLLRSHRQN